MNKDLLIVLLIFTISFGIFVQGLNKHGLEFRDDESIYFQSTKEMFKNKNYMSPTLFGENRFQKPILFYWLVILFYKIFGVNWFSARIISVIFGSLSLCLTWMLAKELFDKKTAYLSTVILITIPLFFRHAKNVVPDMALNFFVLAALYFGFKFIKANINENLLKVKLKSKITKDYYNLLFFISCALGFIIKGYVAVLIPIIVIVIYATIIKAPKILVKMNFTRGIFILILIIVPWFLYMLLTHGSSYVDYMLNDETKYRIIGKNYGNFIFIILGSLIKHFFVYLRIILSYFSPWSIFFFISVPIILLTKKNQSLNARSVNFLLIWIISVLIFFSSLFFVINHYMLIITTPVAILISYFLLNDLVEKKKSIQIKNILQKFLILFIFSVGYLAIMFFLIFIIGISKLWFPIFLLFYFILLAIAINEDKIVTPFILALFIALIYSQPALIENSGVTAHSSLRKFAKTINSDNGGLKVIGVGSNDIHEKEFQVYFDDKVIKAAHSYEELSKTKLKNLFKNDNIVYCLITEKDFKNYMKDMNIENFDIVQEDFIFRKRMNLDKNFFMALLKFDKKTVKDYLMEKLILVRRKQNV